MDRVLTLDVGNSNTVVGVFEGGALAQTWRIATRRDRTVDELGLILRALFREASVDPAGLDGVVICSVVPPLLTKLAETCTKYFGLAPLFVGPGIKTGLPVLTENPREVGADRVVNAVAAIERFGAPVIVVNLGTATTVCVIDDRGQYLGGVIAPGMEIASEALFERAAKLPHIELVCPKSVIGRNTVHSMQSGVVYGFAGLVDGIVLRISSELQLPFRVIATGGMAGLVSPISKYIEAVEPNLSLLGLRLLWEKNR